MRLSFLSRFFFFLFTRHFLLSIFFSPFILIYFPLLLSFSHIFSSFSHFCPAFSSVNLSRLFYSAVFLTLISFSRSLCLFSRLYTHFLSLQILFILFLPSICPTLSCDSLSLVSNIFSSISLPEFYFLAFFFHFPDFSFIFPTFLSFSRLFSFFHFPDFSLL